ncbi:MAG: hypothetical protein KatS3mg082_1107 [Nitrospiraceae bacterium]|nr:MAG: hypothetical protein KatS3mg082_1107 [Nitrospiraceae bacterium]
MAMPNTRLQMLPAPGRTSSATAIMPTTCWKKFIERSAVNGIDVFRIFDALNDVRNLERAIREVKISAASMSKPRSATNRQSGPTAWSASSISPGNLEDLGTDTLCIKDMARLLAPFDAYALVRKLKAAVRVPIHLHTHYTSGMASMSSLMAILAGLDMLDTAISPLAGGTSHPPTESLVAACATPPYDTGLELRALEPIAEHFRTVRTKNTISSTSDFTGVDARSDLPDPRRDASNLAAQLAEQNALDRMKEVLEEVPPRQEGHGISAARHADQPDRGHPGDPQRPDRRAVQGHHHGNEELFSRPVRSGTGSGGPGRNRPARSGTKSRSRVGRPTASTRSWTRSRANCLLRPDRPRMNSLTALFPTIAREFFEARERGELTPGAAGAACGERSCRCARTGTWPRWSST